MRQKHKKDKDAKASLVRIDEGTALLSSKCRRISFEATKSPLNSLRNAISKLSELEDCNRLREDAVLNGKAIINNWQPPSDQEIDKIILNMKKRLLA